MVLPAPLNKLSERHSLYILVDLVVVLVSLDVVFVDQRINALFNKLDLWLKGFLTLVDQSDKINHQIVVRH